MLTARKGLDGHSVYGRVRNSSETLEKLGVDGNDKARDQQVRQLREEGATIGTLLQYGLPSEQLRRCGYPLSEMVGSSYCNRDTLASWPDVQQLLAKVDYSIETLFDSTKLDFSGKMLDSTMMKVLAELAPLLKVVSLK